MYLVWTEGTLARWGRAGASELAMSLNLGDVGELSVGERFKVEGCLLVPWDIVGKPLGSLGSGACASSS